MKTLAHAKIGSTVTVREVYGSTALRQRFMDLGITKGARILLRRTAPLGDPLQIRVRGSELCLRKSDAEMVEVQ